MEFVLVGTAVWNDNGPTGVGMVSIAGPMSGAVDSLIALVRGTAPCHFHDVNFPARRPAYRGDIFSEHPECRPQTLPRWQGRPNVNAPIFKRALPFRNHSGRRVLEAPKGFFFGRNEYTSVKESGIFCSVVFQFIVPPAPISVADFKGPIVAQGRRVKFIVPNQGVAWIAHGCTISCGGHQWGLVHKFDVDGIPHFDVNIKCAVGTNTYWIVPRLGKLMSELSTGFIEQYRVRVLTQLKCEIIASVC